MTIGLLATGDEIIHGDTLNTNSYHIAQTLSSEGLSLGLHLVCSDKENDLCDCINFLSANHDIIIIIGGLGPTSDDRTRFALARALNVSLIQRPEAMKHLENRLMCNETKLNLGNKQQAFFPEKAILIPNPYGTAMGCYYTQQAKMFILLPGPPRECLPMFNHHVLPTLQKIKHRDKQLLKWRLFGVAESQIAQQLDDALETIDCQTGYRLEIPYIECKVRCESTLVEQVQQVVAPIIAPYIIASPEQKASERLYEQILRLQVPITILDDVTGGILQSLIQQPESYSLLKFYDDKASTMHFHLQGLREYWLNETSTGTTQVSIDYKTKTKHGQESHSLPYRTSAWIIHSAAEWLSFRLFHLINELHQ